PGPAVARPLDSSSRSSEESSRCETAAVRALVVDAAAPDDSLVGRAADLLRAGGLVAFPTETVYGLGADATSPNAVARIFEVKGRPASDPLIVHVATIAAARQVAARWDERADLLAARCWPGPLTLVVERAGNVADAVGGGRSTVAVRVPAHPVALALLEAARVPIAAPSANRFGRVSPTTAAHVLDELADRLDPRTDAVLDGGPAIVGVESTVVDLTGPTAVVLRPGGVSVDVLASAIGPVEVPERLVVSSAGPAPAPGTYLRHYSPRTPVVFVDAGPDTVGALVRTLERSGVAAASLDLPASLDRAAAALYDTLRLAEGSAAVLLARAVEPSGVGLAINDRLFRAANGVVVTDASPASVERIVEHAARES
ncbi:MAG: L-threonylcarbamoyladenylate synthase, partial [Actinomycetes bacterium]